LQLFDLMVMGVKMQLVMVHQAADLLEITLNHLDTLRKLVLHSERAVSFIDSLIDLIISVCFHYLLSTSPPLSHSLSLSLSL